MSPKVGIVIINWNGLHDTMECLVSLQDLGYPTYEVIVVDNGSSESLEPLERWFPALHLVRNAENLGYTGGNNMGIRYGMEQGAEYLWLLNNDTVVAPDSLGHLVAALEGDPQVGAAGPLVYYHHRPNTIWSAGGRVDWRRGRTALVGLNERDVGQFGVHPYEVDFVSGCALFLRTAILPQVGLLDERFFAYYEEVEWCGRIQRAGFRIVVVPRARVWHKIRPDRQAESPLVHYYMTRNRLLWLKLMGASWQPWAYTLFADCLRTLCSWSIRPCYRGKSAVRQAMVQALLDAARGRWGRWAAVS